MTWKTGGRVDVPAGTHASHSFMFCAAAKTLRVQVVDNFHARVASCRLTAAWPVTDAYSHSMDIAEFIIGNAQASDSKDMARLTNEVATRTAQYTAAHMLSNIAAIISNYPMSPEAKNQIIAALVMALPNFDDSEACKSPVGNHLVRTREDFMHAAVSARFRHRTTMDEYLAYDNTNKIWDAT